MRNLFSMDSPIFVFLSKVADIVVLNIMFIITCIPVITIGAGTTALYATAMKCICRSDGYVFRTFWKEFAAHFKHSTFTYLLVVLVYGILYVDFRYTAIMFPPGISRVVSIIMLSVTIFFSLMVACIFAYIAVSDTTMKGIFKNSMMIAIVQLPYTVIMILLNLAPVIVTLVTGYIFLPLLAFYFLAGFATVASLNGLLLNKTFKKFKLTGEV